MRPGRPTKTEIKLSLSEKQVLLRVLNSRSYSTRLKRRAQIILMSEEANSIGEIASHLKVSSQTVCAWRKRFLELRTEGLWDQDRPGRPPALSEMSARTLVADVAREPSLSLRKTASRHGASHQQVRRVRARLGIPASYRRIRSLASNEIGLDQVIDVVGVYLHSKNCAFVACIDPNRTGTRASFNTSRYQPDAEFVKGRVLYSRALGLQPLHRALELSEDNPVQTDPHFRRRESIIQFMNVIQDRCPEPYRLLLVSDKKEYLDILRRSNLWVQDNRWCRPVPLDHKNWIAELKAICAIGYLRSRRLVPDRYVKDLTSNVLKRINHPEIARLPFQWVAESQSIRKRVQTLDRIARS
jgi:transposase